ncbi:hypothetical protein [Amphritea sp. HPY]|uniref:hypothetical protein n=1 Tax=Amphritea sp. HPY TaxID=3421652 RepID=UPI003D7C9A68
MSYQVYQAKNPDSQAEILQSLGVSPLVLRNAVEQGAMAFKRSTKLHPITHAGVTAYGEAVRTLREQLIPEGWKPKTQYGLALTYNRDLNVSIIVTSGDKDTGRADGYPTTKNSKGGATTQVVHSNFDLFNDHSDDVDTAELLSNQTWVLLYFIDTSNEEVRYELSLPTGMSGNGKISSWSKRIILDTIALVNDKPNTNGKTEFNEDVDFDISIKL